MWWRFEGVIDVMKLLCLNKRWEQDSDGDDAHGQGYDWLAGTSSKGSSHPLLSNDFAH